MNTNLLTNYFRKLKHPIKHNSAQFTQNITATNQTPRYKPLVPDKDIQVASASIKPLISKYRNWYSIAKSKVIPSKSSNAILKNKSAIPNQTCCSFMGAVSRTPNKTRDEESKVRWIYNRKNNKGKSKSQGQKNIRVNLNVLPDKHVQSKRPIPISILPHAEIDISKWNKLPEYLNITYNNDEIVQLYIKLKSPKFELDDAMRDELKIWKNEIDNFIGNYNKM